MDIPIAQPSAVTRAVFYLGEKLQQTSCEQAAACFTPIESAFYSAIRGGLSNDHQWVKKIKDFAINNIWKIQTVFNAANIGIIFFSSKNLVDSLKAFAPLASLEPTLSAVLIAGSICSISYLIIRQFSSDGNTHSASPFAQSLLTTRLVLSVALSFFSTNPISLAINLLSSSYSLYKASCIRTTPSTFNTSFMIEPAPKFQHFGQNINDGLIRNYCGVTYHMTILPHNDSKDQCVICFDDIQDEESTPFCVNHVFHNHCLKRHIETKLTSVLNNSHISRRTVHHLRNGFHSHTTHSYRVTIPAEDLPNCPSCRVVPFHHTLDISIRDPHIGTHKPNVNIYRGEKDYQPLFEKTYAAYNIVQAGLSYLQTHPELAATIFAIQKYCMVIDAIGLLISSYFLFKKMQEKWGKNAAITSIIALPIVAYIASLGISFYRTPNIDLTAEMSKLDIAADKLKNIAISWSAPETHKVMQFLFTCRILSSAALSYFSKKPIYNIISTVAQTFSLFNISSLLWVRFDNMIDDNPLSGATSDWKALVEKVKTSSHFLLHPSSIKNSKHLQSTLQSIYDHSINLFKGSFWEKWVKVTRNEYGFEIGKTYYYTISKINNVVNACACTLTPHLESLKVTVKDYFHGFITGKITQL